MLYFFLSFYLCLSFSLLIYLHPFSFNLRFYYFYDYFQLSSFSFIPYFSLSLSISLLFIFFFCFPVLYLSTFNVFIHSSYIIFLVSNYSCPVSWGCRIHWLHLCRGVRPPPNECPGYDTKNSDDEVPAVLELWGMRNAPSLPSLPGPLWPGVIAPDRALSMG